jgi:hypothetical protein
MSTRSLALSGLVSSVVLGCGGHSATHSSPSTTSSEAGSGDAGASDASSTHDASSTDDGAAAGDSSATLDAGGPALISAPHCAIPPAATLPGCTALHVICISGAIDCACTSTQYQMLCQATATPPLALGCTAQSTLSAEAPAYCCPCGSDDAGPALFGAEPGR